MLRLTRTLTIAVVTLALYSPARAQKLAKGGLSGVVTSTSTAIPANGSATLFSTPPDGEGFFVLTQVCSREPFCVELNGSTFGRIPTGSDGCTTYDPGIALPPGEILTATHRPTAISCTIAPPVMITGVLTSK